MREMKTRFKLFGGGDQQKIKDNERNERERDGEWGQRPKKQNISKALQ